MLRSRPVGGFVLAAALVLCGLAGCTAVPPNVTFDSPVRFSGAWVQLPSGPLSPRHSALAGWVDDRFLIVGGWASKPCPAEADCPGPDVRALSDGAGFDPASGEWSPIADAPVPVSVDNAVVLAGALYISTGEDPWRRRPVGVWRYEPASDEWTRMPAPPSPSAQLVAGCHRLFAFSPTDALQPHRDFLLDEKTGTWQAIPDDPLGPSFDREAVWADGAVLLSAKDLVASPGSEDPAIVRVARLDIETLEWTELPDSDITGGAPTAVGDLVVFPQTGTADSGQVGNRGRDLPYGGILNAATGAWRRLPEPPVGGGLLGELLVSAGRTVVGGHLLDPATGDWTLVPDLPPPGRAAPAVAAGDDTILVWGGATATDNLGDGYMLRIPPAP